MYRTNFIIIRSALCCYLLASMADGGSGPVDYSKVVVDKLNFVDKTMLIADFKPLPRFKLINTPPKFGKSTIIDMLKRFYSIPVDSQGVHIQPNTTANYRLFCDNKLKICENKTFMDRHFGRYPVVHIDYHFLGNCSTFEMLLHNLRRMISRVFSEHLYLQHNNTLFMPGLKDFFLEHCDMSRGYVLDEDDIYDAFSWLTNLLKQKFRTKPIVLIDEYDAYGEQFFMGEPRDVEKSLFLIYRMTRKIFDQYQYAFHRGMMAGIIRLHELGYKCIDPNVKMYMIPKSVIYKECRWLGDHKFAKYYGFTESEVRVLLSRRINSEKQINQTIGQLEMYYGGYKVKNQNVTLFNMWSVLQFIKDNLEPETFYEPKKIKPKRYWRTVVRLKVWDKFCSENFMNMLTRQLIYGTGLYGMVERYFGQMDVIKMKTQNVDKTRKLIAVMLCDLGLLVPDYNRSVYNLKKYDILKIPNLEVQMDIAQFVSDWLVYCYSYKKRHVEALYQSVSNFKFIENNTQNYEDFYHALEKVLLNNNDHGFKTRTELYNFLFVLFSANFANGRRGIGWLATLQSTIDDMPEELKKRVSAIKRAIRREQNRFFNSTRTNKGKSDIVIYTGNPERIALVLEIRVLKKAVNIKRSLNELAWNTLTEALSYDPALKKECELLFDYKCIKPKGKIYIGMSIYLPTKDMSMAFYYVPFEKPYLVENTYEHNPH